MRREVGRDDADQDRSQNRPAAIQRLSVRIEKTKTAKAELTSALHDAFAYCNRAYDTLPLKQMTRPYWASRPNETDLRIELLSGGTICLRGADHYDSLRGDGLDFLILDQSAPIPVRHVPIEQAHVSWTFERQQSAGVCTLDQEARFSGSKRLLSERGLQSGYTVPITTTAGLERCLSGVNALIPIRTRKLGSFLSTS